MYNAIFFCQYMTKLFVSYYIRWLLTIQYCDNETFNDSTLMSKSALQMISLGKTFTLFDVVAYFVARATTFRHYRVIQSSLLSLFEVVTALASLGKDGGCPLQSAE